MPNWIGHEQNDFQKNGFDRVSSPNHGEDLEFEDWEKTFTTISGFINSDEFAEVFLTRTASCSSEEDKPKV